MSWIIRLSKEAERDLETVPSDRQQVIGQAIDRMKADPFAGDVKPLKGKGWKGWYRKVVGRYRIIFTPDHQNQAVQISRILIRSEKTYR